MHYHSLIEIVRYKRYNVVLGWIDSVKKSEREGRLVVDFLENKLRGPYSYYVILAIQELKNKAFKKAIKMEIYVGREEKSIKVIESGRTLELMINRNEIIFKYEKGKSTYVNFFDVLKKEYNINMKLEGCNHPKPIEFLSLLYMLKTYVEELGRM